MRTLGGGVKAYGMEMVHNCHLSPLSPLRGQLPAGNPVAALTAHRAVIHYRDCASLTPRGEALSPTNANLTFQCFCNFFPCGDWYFSAGYV